MRAVLTSILKARFVGILLLLATTLTGCNTSTDVTTYFSQADYREESPAIVANGEVPASYSRESNYAWQTIALPHVVRGTGVAKSSSDSTGAQWTTHWYRFRWHEVGAKRDIAIYIPRSRWPRLQGRLDVYINGNHLDGRDIVWNSLILLTPSAIARGAAPGDELQVAIALSLQHGQSGALSRVAIGPLDELRMRFAWRQFLQQRVPQVTGISFAILGAFSLVFWLYRRNELAYLLFGALALVNVVRNMHYYFIDPAVLNDWFWWVTINSLGWMMLLGHLFAFRLHAQKFPRVERVLIAAVTSISVASLLAVWAGVSIEIWGPLDYLVQIPVGIMVPIVTSIGAWRGWHASRAKSAILLAGALWLNVVFGVHDFLLTNWRIDPESVILLPYGALVVLAVFFLSIARRYLAAINKTEQLNASLELRLADRSKELETSHVKLRAIEQEQAVIGERQRLMREMHDGLGSSLMSSLVMVEQGKLDNSQVATVLRESIDDLKLTIDSLEPMGDDLLTLLGTLRYRLGKRLESAGLKLEWQVQETPPLTWLNPTASLQILRILQEVLANILKHARATVIRIETGVDAQGVYIRIRDNGAGFDVEAASGSSEGRGLQNLRRRAAIVDGTVAISSRPGATVVTLRLPLVRMPAC